MRATAIEFRLRMVIILAIILLGLWSPWIAAGTSGRRITLLEWLPLQVNRLGLLPFSSAAIVVIALGAFIAALGAFLRIAGSAYLGPGTVIHARMLAGNIMANGPYRYVRNPLYLGLWFTVAAVAFLMPPSGALCIMLLLSFFVLRLTLGEEAFLIAQIGPPYLAYLKSVPRFFPRLRTTLPRQDSAPHWLKGALAEITPIGVFLALAFFSWNYDSRLMGQVILVSFGLSLVVRALTPQESVKPAD